MTYDDFNKLALAIVAIVGAFAGPIIAYNVVSQQVETQRAIARRAAIDNVSAKRQVWIDELRADIAKCITLWAGIPFLWERQIGASNSEAGLQATYIMQLQKYQMLAMMDPKLPKLEPPVFQQPTSMELFVEIEKGKEAAREIAARIELRLNPTKDLHQQIVLLLAVFEHEAGKLEPIHENRDVNAVRKVMSGARLKIVGVAQKLFRQEWKRISEGKD